jgi:hypothetical protein
MHNNNNKTNNKCHYTNVSRNQLKMKIDNQIPFTADFIYATVINDIHILIKPVGIELVYSPLSPAIAMICFCFLER